MRDEMKNGTGNPALEKSFPFALWIVKLYQYLSEKKFASLQPDCEDLIRMLGSTQLTMKTKLQKGQKS